jgi:ankyrin repeat protein
MEPDSINLLYQAAVRGDLEKVQMLLKLGTDVNKPLENGNRVMLAVVGMGDARLPITKLLVAHGGDINTEISGVSMLRWINDPAFCENEETISFLRSRGAKE